MIARAISFPNALPSNLPRSPCSRSRTRSHLFASEFGAEKMPTLEDHTEIEKRNKEFDEIIANCLRYGMAAAAAADKRQTTFSESEKPMAESETVEKVKSKSIDSLDSNVPMCKESVQGKGSRALAEEQTPAALVQRVQTKGTQGTQGTKATKAMSAKAAAAQRLNEKVMAWFLELFDVNGNQDKFELSKSIMDSLIGAEDEEVKGCTPHVLGRAIKAYAVSKGVEITNSRILKVDQRSTRAWYGVERKAPEVKRVHGDVR